MPQTTDYIIALTHLYGMVSPEMVVDIYNQQNDQPIDLETVQNLYEKPPKALEKAFVYPAENYFVHQAIVDFDEVVQMLLEKGKKPYYVPEKGELLKYIDDNYFEKDRHFKALRHYLAKHFFNGDHEKADEITTELYHVSKLDPGFQPLADTFDQYNLIFHSEAQIQEVAELYVNMANNSRRWENNGHTPSELSKRPQPVKVERVGRNEPCPCGSGKKYKKCCMVS